MSLPPDCPIVPLGVSGDWCFVRRKPGDIVGFTPRHLKRWYIFWLFDLDLDLVSRLFPGRRGNAWDPRKAVDAILAACAGAGTVRAEDCGFVVQRFRSGREQLKPLAPQRVAGA